MSAIRVLSVGYDPGLMSVRSLVLRRAGYIVEEAYSLASALACAEKDSIDLLLICHTVPRGDQRRLVDTFHHWRRSLPILCITNSEYAVPAGGCKPVENTPVELLDGVRSATKLSGLYP
jgi:CheY-like chemotaxis protein